MNRPPLLVELAGPAGVGKSSLLRSLSRRGIAAESTVWGLPVIPLLSNGLRLLPTLFGLWRHSGSFLWDESRHLVRLETLRGMMHRPGLPTRPVVIFDEGPIFALAWLRGFGHGSLRGEAAAEWWQSTLRNWGEIMDAVVVLDAPDPLLAQRIRTRPHPHEIKQASDAEIAAWMARFRTALEWVLDGMAGPGGPVVLRVTTEQEQPDALADLVASALGGMPYDD